MTANAAILPAVQIDLDDDERDDENGSQGLFKMSKPAPKPSNAESDSDLDLEYRPSVKRCVAVRCASDLLDRALLPSKVWVTVSSASRFHFTVYSQSIQMA